MDELEINRISEIVSTYQKQELADKIVGAFAEGRGIGCAPLHWSKIARVLESRKPFSLGLSGKVGLGWNDISTTFPHIHITNRLSKNVYSGLTDKMRYLVLQSIGRDSISCALHLDYQGAYEVRERGNYFGTTILLNPMDGRSNNIFISQDVTSGFMLDHESGKVYPIDELSDFVQSE